MRALLFRAALERISGRLATLAPDLEVVVLEPDGRLTLKGETLTGEADPEVLWLSRDALGPQLTDFMGHLSAAKRARWVQTAIAGLDHPVWTPLADPRLQVSNSSAQGPAIAEYVTIHALSLLHPIAETARHQANHAWKRVDFREVAETRWLIIGFGNIGQEIARRARAFGAAIEVVRRSDAPHELADQISSQADLPQRLPHADVVVLACPLTEATRDMADAAFFAAMKPGSILVNIGRGGLVDEDALKLALDQDRPAHAVLDVFRTEPLPTDSWIWDHPKVRMTPHSSNRGSLTGDRGDQLFLDNLARLLKGETPHNLVPPGDIGVG